MRLEILAAHDELVRLLGAIQRSKPDLAVLDVSDGSARRNIRRMTGIDSFRLAACPRNSPNGLFCACGIAGGIWHLSRRILTAAADVYKSIGVRGEAQFGELLTVVFAIFGELAHRKDGSLGSPDVSLALLIENPAHATAVF